MSSITLLILGLLLLFIGGESLVRGSVSIALKLRVSTLIVGMTIVSFATSAPELFVSLQSLFYERSSIALGNIIGSNIANLGLVLSCTAIICNLKIARKARLFYYPFLLFCSFLLVFSLLIFSGLSSMLGGFFLLILILFLILLVKRSRINYNEVTSSEENVGGLVTTYSWFKSLFFLIIGLFLLKYGADLLVQGAIEFAKIFNVSDRVVGLTIVAIGTSIPELATSIIAAVRKEVDLAVGNLIGSNIFNILAVLGFSSLLDDVVVDDSRLIYYDSFWMIGITLLLGLFIYFSKGKKLSKLHGFIMIVLYFVYMYFTIR